MRWRGVGTMVGIFVVAGCASAPRPAPPPTVATVCVCGHGSSVEGVTFRQPAPANAAVGASRGGLAVEEQAEFLRNVLVHERVAPMSPQDVALELEAEWPNAASHVRDAVDVVAAELEAPLLAAVAARDHARTGGDDVAAAEAQLRVWQVFRETTAALGDALPPLIVNVLGEQLAEPYLGKVMLKDRLLVGPGDQERLHVLMPLAFPDAFYAVANEHIDELVAPHRARWLKLTK